MLGHGGPGDKTDALAGRLVGLAIRSTRCSAATTSSTTGIGRDVVIGGVDDDSITTNRGETAGSPDAGGIVFGDNGFVDWTLLDLAPGDIDRIWSTRSGHGRHRHDHDRRRRRRGHRRRGRRARDRASGATAGTTVVHVERYLADGDTIVAGNGRNLVFGDNGRITSAVSDASRFGSLPLTLGLSRRSSR